MKIWNLLVPRKQRGKSRSASSEPYHAVTIEFNPATACDKVIRQEGCVYLSDEAPRIPLEGCRCRNSCRCYYLHMRDRRTGPRRYSDIGFSALPFVYERRKQNDRRGSVAQHA